MAQRKTLRSLDFQLLLSALASLIAVIAIGVHVHGVMWAGALNHDESKNSTEGTTDQTASAPSKAVPAPRVRISSKTLAA